MRRIGWQVVLAALLGAPLGCQTLPELATKDEPTVPESKGGRERVELPPPEAAKVCLNTAQQLEKGGKRAQAIGLYEKARSLDPRLTQVSRRLAVLYDRQGDFGRALEEYQKAVALTPKNADLLNDMGYSHYNHGNMVEAEKCLREALVHNPKHPRTWVNLGLVLGEQERYEECLAAFTRVIPEAQAHCNMAFILSTQGKREEAKAEYRRALALDHSLVRAQGALDKLRRAPSTSGAPAPTLSQALNEQSKLASAAPRNRPLPASAPARPEIAPPGALAPLASTEVPLTAVSAPARAKSQTAGTFGMER